MNKNKKIKIIFLCFVAIITPLYTNIFSFNHLASNINEDNKVSLEKLKNSDYSSFYEGNGEDVNVSLQQSLLDNSVIEISDVSDSNNNTFYEPCPTVENFNSSFTEMTIEDIYAPNKNLIVQDAPWSEGQEFLSTSMEVGSFKVAGTSCCILKNVSIMYDTLLLPNNATVHVHLYNSTWNGTASLPGIESNNGIYLGIFTALEDSLEWNGITGLNFILNNSYTENNTWFIGLKKEGSGTPQWRYQEDDSVAPGANGDNSYVYYYDAFSTTKWKVRDPMFETTRDYFLKVGLSPYISHPNTTLIVEDSPWANFQDFSISRPAATSFQVESDLYLENVSVYLSNINPSIATVRVVLYNSVWNSSNSISIPGGTSQFDYILLDVSNISASSDGWHTVTGLHTFLNNSKTDNNTWFIGLWDISILGGDLFWYYTRDISGTTDGIDETMSYLHNSLMARWDLIIIQPQSNTIDLHLKLGVSYDKNIPKPADIGLKINNTDVIGYSDLYGFGYWNSTQNYSSSSGQLEFVISADWWDVSCKITQVQINYIKTDLNANSVFRVLGSEQDVLWNVSRTGGINLFDARLSDYRINFTITSIWNNIQVFNGPINKTNDISISPDKNGYKIVQVLNAGNGTYWHLTATTENLIASIDTYIDSTATDIVSYSDIVKFNATFKETIGQNDGNINLSIYDPAAISNKLNFTSVNSTFDSGLEFYLGSWDISDTVTDYGEFRVQISWNNGTSAGFREKILTIIGETDLSLITPNQYATFYTNQSFDIVVYYEDFNLFTPIDGATIQYNIDGQGWQSTTANNGTVGYYIVSVDCSVFTSDGLKTVEINASKQYYSSQVLTYNFNIIVIEEPSRPSKPEIPGYNLIVLIGLVFIITVIIFKKKYK